MHSTRFARGTYETPRLVAPALAVLVSALAAPAAAQEYASSVVGTEFDYIRDGDPDTFLCLEYAGRRWREMPDKTREAELVQEAFVFVAWFDDGTQVDLALSTDFGDEETARREALRYTPRLGKLPTALRRGVERVVVHAGRPQATAFSDRGLMVLYSANATRRIETHDLEETVFHEAVHAAWDAEHASSAGWRAAQESDGVFATRYGQEEPGREDLAESALFAYALLHHPGRIPELDAQRLRDAIPARIAYVAELLPPGEPLHFPVGEPYACDGSGETFHVDGPRPSRTQSGGDGARLPWSDAAKVCGIDRTTARGISDIVSNALMRGLGREEARVQEFLAVAKREHETADELVEATARHFGLERAVLDQEIVRFIHCNCSHGPVPPTGPGGLADRRGDEPAAGSAEPAAEQAAAAAGASDPAVLAWLRTLTVLLALVLAAQVALIVLVARRRPVGGRRA